MRKVIATLVAAACLFLGSVVAPSPASALDDWNWSACRYNVMWADDHGGGYNFWHTDWPWDFNGYKVNQYVGAASISLRFWDIGGECSSVGFPVSNITYSSHYGNWYQSFNCGSMHTYGSWNQYVYISYYGCIHAT